MMVCNIFTKMVIYSNLLLKVCVGSFFYILKLIVNKNFLMYNELKSEVIMLKDKEFLKKLFSIGLPVAIQNLVISTINLVDVFMIGSLGEAPLAALGLANQIIFVMIILLYGINSGAGVMTAQYFGKKDLKSINKVFNIALWFSLISVFIFFLGSTIIPEYLISIFTNDLEVIKYGAEYLTIVSFSYFATAMTFAATISLRMMTNTKSSLIASTVSLFVNIILNYLLIFGHYGFPKLGVKGAAIATVIARVVEFLYLYIDMKIKKYSLKTSIKIFKDIKKEFIITYLKISYPVIFHELFWVVGASVYMRIYGHMGTSSLAAYNIVASVERIAFCGFFGLASATAVMIGNKIGEGDKELSLVYGTRFKKLSFYLGIFTAFIMLISIDFILSKYNLSASQIKLTKFTMYSMVFLLTFKSFNTTGIIGILRAGGDNRYGLLIDLIVLWLVGIPMAYFASYYLALPIYFVIIFAGSEEFLKSIVIALRVKKGKWINEVV